MFNNVKNSRLLIENGQIPLRNVSPGNHGGCIDQNKYLVRDNEYNSVRLIEGIGHWTTSPSFSLSDSQQGVENEGVWEKRITDSP